MKMVKYVIGAMAGFYALAQIFSLCMAVLWVSNHSDDNNAYFHGLIFGKIAGICVGVAIAFICFRKSKPTS